MEQLALAVGAFRRHGFDLKSFNTAEEVREAFRQELDGIESVGFGGSATLRQLGLDQLVAATDIIFYDHWQKGLSPAEVWNHRLDQGRADLFVTSANAATINGELLLVDGVGNRIAASMFGPKKVIFILGENKIVSDLDAAQARIRDVAAPRRAAELNIDVPCAKTGKCTDCQSPNRICRGSLLLSRPGMGMPTAVWMVRGEWGL